MRAVRSASPAPRLDVLLHRPAQRRKHAVHRRDAPGGESVGQAVDPGGVHAHCRVVWLLPSSGTKAGHDVDVRKPFRRVVTAAMLDPDQILRRAMRHTAITHLVQAGEYLRTVKRISGHKTLAMVERYSHQNGTHIQAAMDKLQARFKPAS